MADNVTFQTTAATPPSGTVVSTEEVSTLNGSAVTAQQVQRVIPAIRTGDGTAVDIPGDSSNGIDVDVTRVSGTVAISAASLPLPSGAATSANQSSELTLIGAVDETAPATDTASSGLNGRLQRVAQRLTSLIALLPTSLGQKAKAASLAVVIASDQDTLAVSAASLPLPSGAATAANQSTANTSLSTLAGAVAGTEVQVDVVGALPAGNNNIGDVDIASIAAGSNTIGATRDAGPSWTTSLGVTGARVTSADMSGAAASVTDAPTSGQKIVVDDIIVSVGTAMRVDFKEETSGTVFLSLYLPANGIAQVTPRSKFKLATADKKLQAQTSASGNIAVTVLYHSEA